jgi:hypothetical protein
VSRSTLARFIALTFGLLGSLATPGLAMVHGYAHGKLTEHSSFEAAHVSASVVSPIDQEAHHSHGAVTIAMTSRGTGPSVALPACPAVFLAVVGLPNERVRAVKTQDPFCSAEPPPNPTRAPPSNY